MISIEGFLEVINEIVILPILIINLILSIYILISLNKKDPDLIKARIFLKYDEFKKAFLILLLFAFLLILHVILIYNPHFLYLLLNCSSSFAQQLQHFFGLALSITIVIFAFLIYRITK